MVPIKRAKCVLGPEGEAQHILFSCLPPKGGSAKKTHSHSDTLYAVGALIGRFVPAVFPVRITGSVTEERHQHCEMAEVPSPAPSSGPHPSNEDNATAVRI